MSYLNNNYSITSKARKPNSKNKKTDTGFSLTKKEIDAAWAAWDGAKSRAAQKLKNK